jgi:hypothetical protein
VVLLVQPNKATEEYDGSTWAAGGILNTARNAKWQYLEYKQQL